MEERVRAKAETRAHLLGNLLEVERSRRRDNDLLVNLHAREGSNLGSRGDDDVLGADGLLASLVEGDLDL